MPTGQRANSWRLISIDEFGRMALPKAIREAVNLGKGTSTKVRVTPGGKIEIEPLPPAGRRLKRIGRFLVAVTNGRARYIASIDVCAERRTVASR